MTTTAHRGVPRRAGWRAGGLTLMLLLGGCGDGRPSEPPAPDSPISLAGALRGSDCLVLVLDALHAAHLGAWGGRPDVSPHLDRLAAEGVRVERAWAPSSWTLPSTASLFTGLWQETHGVEYGVLRDSAVLGTKRLAEEALTLADLFSAAGYATTGYTQNAWVSANYGLTQGFDEFKNVRSDQGTTLDWDLAEDLAQIFSVPGERPRFTYVHFRRPHTPFDAPSEVLSRFTDPTYTGLIAGNDEEIEAHNRNQRRITGEDARHYLDRYLANIHHIDRCLGRLLEGIDLERTLVVVLSDHGEAFGQHGMYGHNWLSFEEYVHVPLVLAHARLPREFVLQGLVSTLDLLPTLAELFALPLEPGVVQGVSFAGAMARGEPASRELLFTSARKDSREQRHLAVFDGRFKYLRQHPGGREWFYDLEADPGEQQNVLSEWPADVARLRTALGQWLGSQRPRWVEMGASGNLSAEALEDLRQLGYLGDVGKSDDDFDDDFDLDGDDGR